MDIKLKVTNIGEMVEAFGEENLLILFGPKATNELKPISVMHEFQEDPEGDFLKPGTLITINDETFTITQVGSAANDNFNELGHVSIYFKENVEELLPGAVQAEPEGFPDIKEGDIITFTN
ncbi:PTS system glucitol/sorbitol-specific IIA component [Streptohalobacillus salinus]|uniref:PTS system glucitol/sorbitol-specific IIA component n=1 Tax=Streptohalobacillus salinus TaxID=621096 RepID=A0A2V3W0U7_9BACI|nr:PTS glucitol/sorbitol transporter subunit IIA [Streptohalobacillus salinus]PXW86708.1 PTS system glucitol/sorbitol-specific IIA component [Streptohalobacillus salinus]